MNNINHHFNEMLYSAVYVLHNWVWHVCNLQNMGLWEPGQLWVLLFKKIYCGKFFSFTVSMRVFNKFDFKMPLLSFSWLSVVRVIPSGLWPMGCRHTPLGIVSIPSNTLTPWRSTVTSVWHLWWCRDPGPVAGLDTLQIKWFPWPQTLHIIINHANSLLWSFTGYCTPVYYNL